MKVITFSRTFPAYHPKKGQPTFFVEKIWAGLADSTDRMQGSVDMDFHEYYNGTPKWHTIRSGNRWKVGDFFSPRFWSGKPYASKQSLITEPLEIKKVWSFDINGGEFKIDDKVYGGETESIFELLELIALNDGLNRHDLMEWFKYPKPFSGQIICWNDKIEY